MSSHSWPSSRTRGRSLAAAPLLLLIALAPAAAQARNDAASPSLAPPGAGGAPAHAADEVGLLRDEVAALRLELGSLAAELRALRSATAALSTDVAAVQEPPSMLLPPEMLQAQVEELAQVKVESGSRFPVTALRHHPVEHRHQLRRRQLARESQHRRPGGRRIDDLDRCARADSASTSTAS